MYTFKKIDNIWDLISFLNTENIKPSDIIKLEKDKETWLIIYYKE